MNIIPMILAAVGGAMLPMQVAINTTLARHGAGAIWAAMVSFAVGTVGLLAIVAVQNHGVPGREALSTAPWWAWVGGLLGAFYVGVTIWSAPRIGAALLFALIVFGQMTMSSGLDHFGAFELPTQAFTFSKFAGIVLILVGVVLIQR